MKYKLLTSDNPNKLSEKVTEKLSEGWQLHGSPFAYEDWDTDPVYGQAVVKGKGE